MEENQWSFLWQVPKVPEEESEGLDRRSEGRSFRCAHQLCCSHILLLKMIAYIYLLIYVHECFPSIYVHVAHVPLMSWDVRSGYWIPWNWSFTWL